MSKKKYAVYYRNSPFDEWTFHIAIRDKKTLKKYIKSMKEISEAFGRDDTLIGVMQYEKHGDFHWTEPADHPQIMIQ